MNQHKILDAFIGHIAHVHDGRLYFTIIKFIRQYTEVVVHHRPLNIARNLIIFHNASLTDFNI